MDSVASEQALGVIKKKKKKARSRKPWEKASNQHSSMASVSVPALIVPDDGLDYKL